MPQIEPRQPSYFDSLIRVAKSFALSQYFDDLKGDGNQQIAQAFTKIITGQEFGVPASASIRGIHIVKGKPVISAGLMSGLIKRSPKYDYRVAERSAERCKIECFEYVDGSKESLGPAIVWDMEKAKRAGVTGNPTWKRYPDRMLFARAISEACTIYFPDLLLGNVYTPDELDATDASFVEVEHTEPEREQQPEAAIEAPSEEQPARQLEGVDERLLNMSKALSKAENEGNLEDALAYCREKADSYPKDLRVEAFKIIESFESKVEFAETPEFFQ